MNSLFAYSPVDAETRSIQPQGVYPIRYHIEQRLLPALKTALIIYYPEGNAKNGRRHNFNQGIDKFIKAGLESFLIHDQREEKASDNFCSKISPTVTASSTPR